MVKEAQSRRFTRTRVVVPVKGLATAKSRLAGVMTEAERARLVLAMLRAVLGGVTQVEGLDPPLVVTSDPAVEREARACGAGVLIEAESCGLNAAMNLAAGHLERSGYGTLFYLPADVPLVKSGEIARLHALHRTNRAAVTLVPSNDGSGTNALLVTPPRAMDFRFGPGSFAAHLEEARSRKLACQELSLEGIGHDIDGPQDLALIRAAGKAQKIFEPELQPPPVPEAAL